MRLSHLLVAVSVVGAAANGCGGGAFESANEVGTAGKVSSDGGTKAIGSGGKTMTQPASAGDDSGTSEGGADGASGGSGGTDDGGTSSGGQPPLGGASGSSMAGTSGGGGVNAGTSGGGSGGNGMGVDGPLKVADLEALDAAKMSGFNAAGFRCKSLSVCGIAQTCVYFTDFLGSVQSQDEPYSDGDELDAPQAVKVRIAGGAQSMCSGALFTTLPGQFVKLTHDGGHSLQVYFPEFSGTELVLYVRADGSTYWDPGLTQLAASPPPA